MKFKKKSTIKAIEWGTDEIFRSGLNLPQQEIRICHTILELVERGNLRTTAAAAALMKTKT